jgi:glucosamine--fructose-6-phosphate aminotransferase (isomerizing)
VADAHIALDAGAEKAVPATKTFTAQVAALALLATTVQPGLVAETEWRAAIEGLREVLAAEQDMAAATEAVASSATTLCIARGLLYGAALECALSETTGRSVTGISAADLLHGPIAMVNERSSVIGLAAATPGRRDLDEAAAKAMTRGASYISIGPPGTAPPSSGGIRVHVPAVAEILTILVHTVRAQQLARGLALRDGLDPDRPQGLTKVTPTG